MKEILVERPTKTVYRDGNVVVKSFKKDYPHSQVLNEALNQARVEEIGLPIPKIIGVTTIDECWSISSEYIPGPTMASLIDANPEHAQKYLEMLADLQILVHSKRCPLLNQLKDKLDTKIEADPLSYEIKYELRAKLASLPNHNKVCHGDFNPTNVIIKEDGSLCLLDWSHATQGNGSSDAALCYLYFAKHNQISLGEKYLAIYSQKTNTEMTYLKLWIPIMAASQLSMAMNDEDKKFYLSFLEGLEY